jgi:hypothetical protein
MSSSVGGRDQMPDTRLRASGAMPSASRATTRSNPADRDGCDPQRRSSQQADERGGIDGVGRRQDLESAFGGVERLHHPVPPQIVREVGAHLIAEQRRILREHRRVVQEGEWLVGSAQIEATAVGRDPRQQRVQERRLADPAGQRDDGERATLPNRRGQEPSRRERQALRRGEFGQRQRGRRASPRSPPEIRLVVRGLVAHWATPWDRPRRFPGERCHPDEGRPLPRRIHAPSTDCRPVSTSWRQGHGMTIAKDFQHEGSALRPPPDTLKTASVPPFRAPSAHARRASPTGSAGTHGSPQEPLTSP